MYFSALDKIIVQGYKALQLEYFFTAGPDEVKAWTIQVNKYIDLLIKLYCVILYDITQIKIILCVVIRKIWLMEY